MQALIIVAVTFGLLWVLFILPQQRRVRAHQQLVTSLKEGDEVVLTAGIFARILTLGPEEMTVEAAPGVELRVARMAVLRRVEHAVPTGVASGQDEGEDEELDDEYDDHELDDEIQEDQDAEDLGTTEDLDTTEGQDHPSS